MEDLSQYELGKCIGTGGNSKVYEVKGHPDKVIGLISSAGGFGIGREKEISQDIKLKYEAYQKVPRSVNAPRYLAYGMYGKYVGVLMERVKGFTIHDRKENFKAWQERIRILADIPQNQYNKLIQDELLLISAGFDVDPSKPDNFYYDPKTGFSFIDLNLGRGRPHGFVVPFVYTYLFYKNLQQLTDDDMKMVITIVHKLKTAGDRDAEPRGTTLLNPYKDRGKKESQEQKGPADEDVW